MTEPVRLLMVSDSEEFFQRVTRAVKGNGLRAETERVSSVDEFSAELDRAGWDATISDPEAPGLDIERLLRYGREPPVIVVSKVADDETVERALEAGATDLVSLDEPRCITCAVKRVVRGAKARQKAREVERALRRKDRLLRTVVANAPVIIFATDEEGTIMLFEGKGGEVFGPEHRDVVGLNVLKDMAMVCPELAHDCRQALDGEATSRVHVSPTGLKLDCRCLPIRDDEGRVTGMSCVATDITERVRMQDALKESEARYRALVENTNDMAVSVDTEGTVTYASPQIARLGLDPEDVVGRDNMDFILPEDTERVAADFRRTMETGEEFPTEFRMRDAEGRVRWFEDIGKVQRDDEGRVTGLVGILRDITDRKRAEEELQEAHDELERRVEERTAELHVMNKDLRAEIEVRKATEERLRLAEASIDQSADPTFWVASDARFLRANDAACEALGYTRDELLTMTVQDIDPLYTKEVWSAHWAEFVEKGSLEFESIHRASDGREFPVEILVSLVRFDSQEMMFAYSHDISERKAAEEKVRERNAFLNQVLESLTYPFYVIDAETYRVVLANSAACPTPLADGVACHLMTHGSAQPCREPDHRCPLEDVKRTKAPAVAEHVHLDADGNERIVEVHDYPILGESGEVARVIEYTLDITDRKKAEEEIESLARFPSENPSPVMRVNGGGVIRFANVASGEVLDEWGVAVGQRAPEFWARAVSEAIETRSQRTEDLACCGRDYMIVIAPVPEAGYANIYAFDVTERKRAEEALREERAYLASILKTAPVGIAVTVDRVAVEGNDRVARMLGFGPGEIEGQESRAVYATEEEYERVGAAIREGVEKDGSALVETRMRRTDGVYVDVLLSVAPIDPADPSRGMMNVVTDITDRKRAEEELRESERKFRGVIESSPTGIFEADGDGRVLYTNPQWGAITGMPTEESLGSGWAAALHPDDRAWVLAKWYEYLREKKGYSGRFRFTRPSGETRWVNVRTVPIIDETGTVTRHVGSVEDITESERAAEAVRASEALLAKTQAIGHIGSWELDLDADILTWSDEVYRIFGLQPQEFGATYEGFLQCVHPDDRADVDSAYTLSLRNRDDGYEAEHRIVRRDTGEVRAVREKCEHVKDSSGRLVRSVGMVQDITERKRAEEALREERAYLASIIKTAPIGIGVSEDRIIVEGNEYLLSMVGYPEDEIIGGDTRMVYATDEEYERVGEEIRKGLARDGKAMVETSFRRKDGSDVEVLLSAALIAPADPSRGLMNVFLDITDRKRAEEDLQRAHDELELRVEERTAELAETERRLREFVEGTDALVAQVDAEGRFIYVNRVAEKIFGCPPQKCTGRHAFDFVHPDDRQATEDAFAEWVRDRVTGVSLENRQVSSTGEVSHMLWTINPRYDDDGNVTSIWSVARDITDRKALEERLRQSEAMYRSFITYLPDAVTVADTDGIVMYASEQKARLQRAEKPEALLGADIRTLVAPEDRERYWASFRSAAEGRPPPESTEFRLLRSDGDVFVGEVGFGTIPDADGKPAFVIAMVRDATDRKRAETKLRMSEERYRTLFANVSDAIVLVDGDTLQFEEANPAALNLFAYSSERFSGLRFDTISAEKDETRAALNKALAMEPDTIRIPRRLLLRRNGSTFTAEVSWSAFSVDGKRRIIAVIRDITAREETQEKLRKSEAMYRSLITFLPDAVTVSGPDGVIRYVAEQRAELQGVADRSVLLGTDASSLIAPQDRERYAANFKTALQGATPESAEYTLVRGDGSEFVGDVSFGVIRDADGRPDSVVTVVRDVTSRKQLEKRLEESQRLEAVGRLAGGLAHDFNNLLTAIGGFARRITKKLRPESPLRDDAAQIEKASDMAASLTSQLLAFSRRQTLQPVVLTLNEVLDDVEVILRRLIGENIKLEVKRSPSPGLTLADPGQIGQVIVNLAVNARDAMPHGGVLTIESFDVEFGAERASEHPGVPPGAYVTACVTDTGAGIPPDVLPHIFEPFYTTKELGKGTGLGLSTVYGIVAQSNGHVRVSSEVGRGSTFTVYLPRIAAGHEEEPGGALDSSEETLKGGETILLVEDEEVVKELTRLTLADYGYRVLVASDGEEAIALAAGHEGPIHLLLTDVVMPQMSGREVAERIVAGRPDTKVVFMSGYTDNIEVRGMGGGESPLLPKPFSAEDLALMVREVLDSPQERRAAN